MNNTQKSGYLAVTKGQKASGVYIIRNTVNMKCYIGSSENIHRRWYGHKDTARRGRHHSSLFQEEWDVYGEDAFHFSVLEYLDPIPEKLGYSEQTLIWLMRPAYNAREKVSTRPLSKKQRSEYAKRMVKLNKRRLASGVERTPESFKRQALSRIGLSEAQLIEMCKLHKEGWLQKDLAVKFNVSPQATQRIVTNKIKAFSDLVDVVGQNNAAKIQKCDAEEIIRMDKEGVKTRLISEKFGISMSQVRRVVRGDAHNKK